LRCVFNWWIGLFYGVVPSTFVYGHSVNHHRHNNGPCDVVSTADKPRDNFFNFVAYIPRFFLYACNVTTAVQFAHETNYRVVRNVIMGSVYFLAWFSFWTWLISPSFSLTYLLFPFFEQSLLLSAVNWSWHCFMDPNDPENEYVQSITIVDGCINVLHEDAHVVHHQYPGAHWTDHPGHMERHWPKYADCCGSVFRDTHAFEIFGMVVVRDYDTLAKRFVDLHGERCGQPLTHEQRVNLIKGRLRAVWWGPRADAAMTSKLTGKELGNLMDGKGEDFSAVSGKERISAKKTKAA